MNKFVSALLLAVVSSSAFSWEAKITNILHHSDWVAVTLSPGPGPQNCEAGSPYLVKVDETAANQQLFSMLLSAQASGKTIGGYSDPCVNAIWGKTRPTIERLNLRTN